MALSDTTVRQARITGNDYSLGDKDGLALNVTARGDSMTIRSKRTANTPSELPN